MTMIPPKPLHSYPWYLRLFFFLQKRKYGFVPEPLLLWGRSPSLLICFLKMWKKLNRKNSPLSGDLRALVCIRVSQINTCPFCIDLNTSLFLQRGGRVEQVEGLSSSLTDLLFTPKEQAAIRYAEAVTQTGSKVDPALWKELKTHFDEDAVVELTALIAFQNMSSKFNSALDV